MLLKPPVLPLMGELEGVFNLFIYKLIPEFANFSNCQFRVDVAGYIYM